MDYFNLSTAPVCRRLPFTHQYIDDPDGFTDMLRSPSKLMAQLAPRGDFGLVPIDESGLPACSLFGAARDADAAERVFSAGSWPRLGIVDFRETGKATVWPQFDLGYDRRVAISIASDLDYLLSYPPTPTEDEMMAGYALEALDRMRAWAVWHKDRAEARYALFSAVGPRQSELLDLAERIFDLHIVVENNQSDTDESDINALTEAVASGIEAVFEAAEQQAGCIGSCSHDQLKEIEKNPLRGLFGTFREIQAHRMLTAAEAQDKRESLVAACEALARAAPFPVSAEVVL